MTTRVRFAPSPTGYLHIGSARTALFNYLYARHVGGKFLLRVEDTDLARSTEESTRSILDGLAWLELTHDEEIVFQSDNAEKHRATARKLLAEGKAYRDFTPKAEPTDANVKDAIKDRARAAQGEKNMRDNPYRELYREESDRRADAGEPFAIRLKVPLAGKTSFEDQVYGLQERDYAETEDLVLLRSDGHPLYNLAVVCDDIEMAITHVIRGQDHLTNTHKQILIYEALGVTTPTFAHLPLIMAPNKGKLSKRKHGEVVSMTTYRDAGFLAAAFRNFLALLGWSAGEEKEIYSLDELIPFVKPELKAAKLWRDEYEDEDKVWFENTINLIRQRFFTLKDFSNQGRAYFSEDFDLDPAAIEKNLSKFPYLETWLPELADRFEVEFGDNPYTEESIETVVKAFTEEKGTKLGVIMNGARTLLTGVAVGPSMLSVFETIGLERTIMRLRSKVAWNQ